MWGQFGPDGKTWIKGPGSIIAHSPSNTVLFEEWARPPDSSGEQRRERILSSLYLQPPHTPAPSPPPPQVPYRTGGRGGKLSLFIALSSSFALALLSLPELQKKWGVAGKGEASDRIRTLEYKLNDKDEPWREIALCLCVLFASCGKWESVGKDIECCTGSSEAITGLKLIHKSELIF